ncbi:MAG: thioredoxin family protein [Gemmatimonadetes bacterium]|nr:thioredoxin family protein [Gemmatimonadota bacterium]
MAETPSTMPPLGMGAPAFALPDTSGRVVTLEDVATERGFLVIFMCNHCPFVKHLRDQLADFGREYQARGLGVVGISSNDAEHYPADSPEAMFREVAEVGYTFPYLYDADQSVAKAYTAACTPDFFLFDGDRQLFYRGQFDSSRPGNVVEVTGHDLRAAADSLLAGREAPAQQLPSIGCNIKWKPGNAPDYFG